MAKAKVKAVRSRDTIVLVYKKKTLNIQKSQKPEHFKEVSDLMEKGNMTGLVRKYLEIAEGIEKFTKGNFKVDSSKKQIFFRGDTTTPMPQSLIQKLKEHYTRSIDYQPLVRFWKKVLLNSNKKSREELFDFMLKNNIPLTDEGDIIVEKGVHRRTDGLLVDCHSKTVDNSIGMTVRMPVEMVDNNRRNECSNGLHVGAPDYVRNHWFSDVILTCIVSPEHVVSVPEDYNATKMRVCEYRVVGLASKSNIKPEQLIFRFEDIFDEEIAVEEAVARKTTRKSGVEKEELRGKKGSVESSVYTKKTLDSMSGKSIKAVIFAEFGEKVTKKLKRDIVKQALEIVAEHTKPEVVVYKVSDFDRLTKIQIIEKVRYELQVDIKMKKKTKDTLILEAIEISKNQ